MFPEASPIALEMGISTIRPGNWYRSFTLILGAAFACHEAGMSPDGLRACCVHLGSREPLYIVAFRASSRVQTLPSERAPLQRQVP